MKKTILFLLLTMACGAALNAQQDPHYSMYMFNGLVLNPAYAGSREQVSTTLIAREQWTGFEGRPRTQSFSIHGPSVNLRHGFGLTVQNDIAGPVKDFTVSAMYAYRIPTGKESALSLGLQGVLSNYRNDFSDLRTTDGGDPVQANPVNLWLPNVGTGIYFNSKRFYAGASVLHLISNELTEQPQGDPVSQRYMHYLGTAGIVLGGENFKVKPSVFLKYQPAVPLQADLNLSLLFKEKFWVGASYRTTDAWVFLAEWQISSPLRIGYAYDLSTNALSDHVNGTHELMLGFDFNFRKRDLVSPRYF